MDLRQWLIYDYAWYVFCSQCYDLFTCIKLLKIELFPDEIYIEFDCK